MCVDFDEKLEKYENVWYEMQNAVAYTKKCVFFFYL